MKRNLKKAAQVICFHSMILLRGLAKVLYGTVTMCLLLAAGWGLRAIPTEGGYAAVGDFIIATVCIVMALVLMYACGCKRSRR